MAPGTAGAQNWVMLISEQHRYQGVSYKSDIIVLSGLDIGDRQVLEQKYNGCDPPCLLDSSDGRFVLKGAGYNPMDVLNCLMTRRGYKVQGQPQQRSLPNIHNKDDNYEYLYQRHHNQQTSSTREAKNLAKALVRRDSELFPLKFAMIYHLAKDAILKRANTNPGNISLAKMLAPNGEPANEEQELPRQVGDLMIK